LVKRASLILSFCVVLIAVFAMIGGANPYPGDFAPFGTTQYGEVPPLGASQYGGALQYGVAEAPQYDVAGGQIMMASYYDYSHAGHPTASGELYDPGAFTAAHKTLPFGTQLLVSHGGASVQVTVNDRGPYADGLDIDLSGAAADAIGLTSLGVAPVEVVVL
jgi:rare lipoprotein A (peptidoglycan hydrolase)